jgi:hypothetical protein
MERSMRFVSFGHLHSASCASSGQEVSGLLGSRRGKGAWHSWLVVWLADDSCTDEREHKAIILYQHDEPTLRC